MEQKQWVYVVKPVKTRSGWRLEASVRVGSSGPWHTKEHVAGSFKLALAACETWATGVLRSEGVAVSD